MKQVKQTDDARPNQAIWQDKMLQDRRREMNVVLRVAMVILLVVLIAAIALAGYSSLYPVVLSVHTNVLNYTRASGIDYLVLTRENELSDQVSLGMDQTYLKDFVDSITTTFTYDFTTDRPANLAWNYRVQAVVQLRDASDPSQVLLQKTTVLLPDITGQALDGALHIRQQVSLDLAEYQAIADAFATLQDLHVVYTLAASLVVQVETSLPAENLVVSDMPTLLVPLSQNQFRLTREGMGTDTIPVVQLIRYQLILQEIPFPVYPVAAGLCVIILIIFLATTRNRRKSYYQRQLNRMLHRARKRIMMISDKAWEPEWCIAISDFNSMVRTARRLNHPIFCYIDRDPENAAAYFYVYYGENNYCFTWMPQGPEAGFKVEHPAFTAPEPSAARAAVKPASRKAGKAGQAVEKAESAAAEPVEPIPVLPETDEDQDIT